MVDRYIVKKEEISLLEGTRKTHFLNPTAKRINKSLGDLTGLNSIGFHIIEMQPGAESTEKHVHYYEEECVYILHGEADVIIGDQRTRVESGDFIGYRAGGKAHTMINTGKDILRCIAVGQRLDHDVADYPDKQKRVFRNAGLPWSLLDINAIEEPVAGKK